MTSNINPKTGTPVLFQGWQALTTFPAKPSQPPSSQSTLNPLSARTRTLYNAAMCSWLPNRALSFMARVASNLTPLPTHPSPASSLSVALLQSNPASASSSPPTHPTISAPPSVFSSQNAHPSPSPSLALVPILLSPVTGPFPPLPPLPPIEPPAISAGSVVSMASSISSSPKPNASSSAPPQKHKRKSTLSSQALTRPPAKKQKSQAASSSSASASANVDHASATLVPKAAKRTLLINHSDLAKNSAKHLLDIINNFKQKLKKEHISYDTNHFVSESEIKNLTTLFQKKFPKKDVIQTTLERPWLLQSALLSYKKKAKIVRISKHTLYILFKAVAYHQLQLRQQLDAGNSNIQEQTYLSDCTEETTSFWIELIGILGREQGISLNYFLKWIKGTDSTPTLPAMALSTRPKTQGNFNPILEEALRWRAQEAADHSPPNAPRMFLYHDTIQQRKVRKSLNTANFLPPPRISIPVPGEGKTSPSELQEILLVPPHATASSAPPLHASTSTSL